jgi:hypothetical protein
MSVFYVLQSEGLVRPGTSDALTARTIDATQHPVAQVGGAVAEVPQIVDSIPPQLVGGALGLSAVLLVVAAQHGRMRLALAPMLMSALLLLPVSNYQTPKSAGAQELETKVAEKPKSSGEEPAWLRRHARADRQEPPPDEPRSFPTIPYPNLHVPDFHVPDFDVPDFDVHDFERVASSEFIEEALPLIEMVVPEDWDREDVKRFLRRNSEKLRREIRRVRSQQHREARRHAYSVEHQHHHHSR